MKTTVKIMAAVLVAGGLLGSCYKGIQVEPVVSFDLPPGWETLDRQPGYTSAVTYQDSHDGIAPHVKLETLSTSTFIGDTDDARSYVDAIHKSSDTATNKFLTLALPNGTDVYANIAPDDFWSEDGEEPSWSSVLAYAKSGYVLVFYLGDRADEYVDELDIVTQSTRITTHSSDL